MIRSSRRRLALLASAVSAPGLVAGILVIGGSGVAGATTTSWTQTGYCQPGAYPLTLHGYDWQTWWLGSGSLYHGSVNGYENVRAANGNNITYHVKYEIYPDHYGPSTPSYVVGRIVADDAVGGTVLYNNGTLNEWSSVAVIAGTPVDLCQALDVNTS